MPLESRASVDARRPQAMFIDVLDKPTISAAVRAASDQLRRGMFYAMSCNQVDPLTIAPRPPAPPHAPAERPASSAAARDPAAVYSALASRSRRPPPQSDPASPPVVIVRESLAVDASAKSAKSAKPTVLAKRPRPDTSLAPASKPDSAQESVFQPSAKRHRPPAADRVFQPVPKREPSPYRNTVFQPVAKRERRPDPPSSASAATPPSRARDSANNAALLAAYRSTNPSSTASKHKLQTRSTAALAKPTASEHKRPELARSAAVERKLAVAKPSGRSQTRLVSKEPATTRTPNKSPALLPYTRVEGATKRANGSAGAGGAGANRSKADALPPVRPLPAVVKVGAQKPTSPTMQRSPGSRKLPPAWSQVASRATKSGATKSILKQTLLKKTPSGSMVAKVTTPYASLLGRTPQPSGYSILQQHQQQQTNSRKTLDRPRLTPKKAAAANAEAMIPLPSIGELKVSYIPGSKTIEGVRPNGYTISREGTVKPVVTFTTKPKVPHKLRQTSVERLFDAWKDEKKKQEGEALLAALRTEQETYVSSTSRVDYRAAMLSKLKELRK